MATTYSELVQRRARHSHTSAILVDGQPTGNLRTIVRARPVHYESAPGAGDWQPVDRTIGETAGDYRTTSNNWRVRLAKTYSGAAPVRVDLRGGFDLGWKLAGIGHLSSARALTVLAPSVTAVAASRAGQVVTYSGVAGGGFDLRYTVTNDALKQDLLLSQTALDALRSEITSRSLGGGYLAIAYAVDLGNMADWSLGLPAGGETGGGIALSRAMSAVVPALGKPIATDAAGRETDCLYRRVNHPQLGPAIFIAVPLQWLAAATAPVVIDPTFYGDAADGIIAGTNATYSTARSTSSANNTTGAFHNTGQRLSGGIYTVWRGFLTMDTSSIPDGDTVSAASLYVKAQGDTSDTDFNVQVYRYAWADTLSSSQEANYDGAYGGSATLEGTLRATSSGWVAGTYYNMAVDTAGINKTGNSRYTLVSSRDVAGNTPGGNEYVNWYTADQTGTGDDPYLDITHAGAAGQPVIVRWFGVPFARPAGFGGARITG